MKCNMLKIHEYLYVYKVYPLGFHQELEFYCLTKEILNGS